MDNKFNLKTRRSAPDKKVLMIVGGVVAVAIVIGIVLALVLPKGDGGESGDNGNGNSVIEPTTEEQMKMTKELLDKVLDVEIDGYYYSEDNPVSNDVVAFSMRNKSDKNVSIGVEIGAYDKDDNLLETSAVFADNVSPNETQRFEIFAYTNLTADQLKSSTYKVYRVWTEETTASSATPEPAPVVEEPEPEPEPEPEAEPEAEAEPENTGEDNQESGETEGE